MSATVGFSGCQTFRFPANPFAGAKLPGVKLPVPRLPSLAKLPKPNFGNIARSVKTPARQAIDSSGTSIASASKQPPPAPSRKFDSTSTDEKLAKFAPVNKDVKPDIGFAKSDSGGELTPAQKRFKNALTKQQNAKTDFVAKANPNSGLWSDYKPDPAHNSSNNVSANNIEELAKVNRGLYDQYGKLTTGSKSPKLSEPVDPEMFAAKAKNEDAEQANQSIAQLKSQLEKIKARGTGSSDEFTVPKRTAIEIAGTAPKAAIEKVAEVSLHKGFGSSAQLKPAGDLANRGTVNIPDPTAPANVLRASADQIPGLIQVTNVAEPGKYSNTNFGGYAKSNLQPSELPTGSLLPQNTEDSVENKFVKIEQPLKIPTLTATAEPKPFEMPLPREVSDASLAALAENARAAEAAPQPKITFQNPIQQKSIANAPPTNAAFSASPSSSSLPPATAVTNTTAVSAFNLPATQSPRVTRNQFITSPMKSSAPLSTPAIRVAQKQADFSPLSIMTKPETAATALPEGIVTGASTYAPGSVVKPQTESRWR